MINYKLLTPGPLTTTISVKEEMLVDHCTWDEDYKKITRNIISRLLELAHVSGDKYTAVLMQGSGTFGVEAVISSVIPEEGRLAVLINGAYGRRIAEIAKYHKINTYTAEIEYSRIPTAEEAEKIITENNITHLAMAHCETTTGILNDIQAIGEVCKKHNVTFITDAMSSFGGIDIPVEAYGIDFLISSANKCIQGVPGFSFIIANKEKFIASKGNTRSLSLDLYAQWETMSKDGKWRFTSPTHVVLVFARALEELEAEGGIKARNKRYTENNRFLIEKMRKMGFKPYIDSDHQSPVITTFECPSENFSFKEMYSYIKKRGYAIYPGKLEGMNTFRIGNIGEIYKEDIEKLCEIIKDYTEEKKNARS